MPSSPQLLLLAVAFGAGTCESELGNPLAHRAAGRVFAPDVASRELRLVSSHPATSTPTRSPRAPRGRLTTTCYIANIADMTSSLPGLLRTIRSQLALTQEELASRLGVSFATVNRWEGGASTPQRAAMERITALAAELGVVEDEPEEPAPRRRGRTPRVPSTKPMEQMLWDAACSIRGEKDAAKFKDYLLPLLFVKRLSDVFDDELDRLVEEFGDQAVALEIAEADHSLLRFYLPPEGRWAVISGRRDFEWPLDERGRSTAPRDIGEHLTKAVRAVVRHNPDLAGVIDVVDFASERNGERDINPAKLRDVVETFSDPRYRLGLADVQPDFLGRAYEYLLRKFAEGSGQSAGEFFTPTEVGYLIAWLMRPKPGETCHDYACGSAGLLIKLQLVAQELDPMSKVPLRMFAQELQAESYAIAQMNTIIHDMDVDLQRGDTIINPKLRNADGTLTAFDIVVSNPMWNQPFSSEIFLNDPFDRFVTAGGITSGKGDWAWLQHTLTCMKPHGRAGIVLDTGAVTRGSGSKNEDRERNIRKWFVEHDFIDSVILLPENLFYNTTAAGVIVVLNKRKAAAHKGTIVMLNASRRFQRDDRRTTCQKRTFAKSPTYTTNDNRSTLSWPSSRSTKREKRTITSVQAAGLSKARATRPSPSPNSRLSFSGFLMRMCRQPRSC